MSERNFPSMLVDLGDQRSVPATDVLEVLALCAVVVGITAAGVVVALIIETIVRMIGRRAEVRRAERYVAGLIEHPLPRTPGRHRADWYSDDGQFYRGLVNAVALTLGLAALVVLCCGAVIVHVAG